MTKGQRIRKAREAIGMGQTELANRIGMSKQNLYKYENSLITNIPSDKIEAIALVCNVSPEYIMGWTDSDSLPTPTTTNDYVTFPVIGEVAAGYEHIAIEEWEGDKINIPVDWLHGRPETDFFVLRIKGDSMYPEYREGDKLLVLKQSAMDYSGQIGVVLYDTENATVKKIEYKQGEDWIKLVPINPNYPIKRIENESLEHCFILGIPRILIREIED